MDKNKNLSNPITKQFLMQYGIQVFGTKKNFETWLNKENFFFDKKAPSDFMHTTEGIKFTDDRLTGIEYGDNV